MSEKVYIMFGGNIGDVDSAFIRAEKYLAEHGFVVDKKSRTAASAAVDCVPDTPDFKDMALAGTWSGTAEELLKLTQQTERYLGRPADHRSDMSRTFDCDIIFFGNETINKPDLVIPHPRMHERKFVLELMVEIAPDFIHPVFHKSIKELWKEIK